MYIVRKANDNLNPYTRHNIKDWLETRRWWVDDVHHEMEQSTTRQNGGFHTQHNIHLGLKLPLKQSTKEANVQGKSS